MYTLKLIPSQSDTSLRHASKGLDVDSHVGIQSGYLKIMSDDRCLREMQPHRYTNMTQSCELTYKCIAKQCNNH